jgi:hypothetical protein
VHVRLGFHARIESADRVTFTIRRTTPKFLTGLSVIAMLVLQTSLHAHNGPPFPVVTDRTVGNYVISLWADPDASDDGAKDGRFWVVVNPSAKGAMLPADTVVQIAIWPVERREAIRTETAQADEREPARRAAAFLIDHEGKYGVKATITGTLGPADIESVVDAEYDARPRPFLIGIFALPFVLIGFVYLKLLIRRRAHKLA